MDDPAHIVDAPSKPPRQFRRTRIAVSVFFWLLFVALIVQWVRSFWWQDYLYGWLTPTRAVSCISDQGWLVISYDSFGPAYPPDQLNDWEASTVRLQTPRRVQNSGWFWQHYRESDGSMSGVQAVLPYWFVVALTLAGIAVVPSLPLSRRFSLRTLLIATTLVAAVLGLGAWMAR